MGEARYLNLVVMILRDPARRVAAVVTGLLAPLAVAAAWIPLRQRYSSLDVALVLVLVPMAVGSLGSVPGALVAAASSAWWFDFFDTKPYAQPTIARGPDLVTFVVLAVVGASTGSLSAAYSGRRRLIRAESEDVARFRSVAELLATSSELVRVMSAIAGQISESLGLSECWFGAAGPGGAPSSEAPPAPLVGRDGTCPDEGGETWAALLPVWAQGSVLGHFVLGGPRRPTQERLLFAVAMADQAGAALAAHGTLPPPPDEGLQPVLRVLPGLDAVPGPLGVRRRRAASSRLSA